MNYSEIVPGSLNRCFFSQTFYSRFKRHFTHWLGAALLMFAGTAYADHTTEHDVQSLKGGLGAIEQRLWDCENGVGGACPGTTGPEGPQGGIGPIGLTGAAGVDGATGSQGATGDTGPQGDIGPVGATGDTGQQGIQGIQGLTGAKGDQGIQGLTGAKGDQGIQGLTGDKGDQGIQGLTGDVGATGAVGPQGLAGNDGAPGVNGSDGTNGTNGADSTVPGPQGVKGPAGPTGAIGPQGPEGPAGAEVLSAQLRFVDNGDGTVTDNQTGLMWEQKTGILESAATDFCKTPTDCPRPHDINNLYVWTDVTDEDIADTAPTGSLYSHFLVALNSFADGALVSDPLLPLPSCFAGHCDWRVPNIAELQGIFQTPCNSQQSPCIDPKFGVPLGVVLQSSSTDTTDESLFWAMFHTDAETLVLQGDKRAVSTAIAVRGGRASALTLAVTQPFTIHTYAVSASRPRFVSGAATAFERLIDYRYCALGGVNFDDTNDQYYCQLIPQKPALLGQISPDWILEARALSGLTSPFAAVTRCIAICIK